MERNNVFLLSLIKRHISAAQSEFETDPSAAGFSID
jgi:hypothetical protein